MADQKSSARLRRISLLALGPDDHPQVRARVARVAGLEPRDLVPRLVDRLPEGLGVRPGRGQVGDRGVALRGDRVGEGPGPARPLERLDLGAERLRRVRELLDPGQLPTRAPPRARSMRRRGPPAREPAAASRRGRRTRPDRSSSAAAARRARTWGPPARRSPANRSYVSSPKSPRYRSTHGVSSPIGIGDHVFALARAHGDAVAARVVDERDAADRGPPPPLPAARPWRSVSAQNRRNAAVDRPDESAGAGAGRRAGTRPARCRRRASPPRRR